MNATTQPTIAPGAYGDYKLQPFTTREGNDLVAVYLLGNPLPFGKPGERWQEWRGDYSVCVGLVVEWLKNGVLK